VQAEAEASAGGERRRRAPERPDIGAHDIASRWWEPNPDLTITNGRRAVVSDRLRSPFVPLLQVERVEATDGA